MNGTNVSRALRVTLAWLVVDHDAVNCRYMPHQDSKDSQLLGMALMAFSAVAFPEPRGRDSPGELE